MNSLQSTFDNILKELPQIILRQVLREKLADAGAMPDEKMVERLAIHVLSDKTKADFLWDDGMDQESHVSLSLSVEDIEEKYSKLTESLPDVLDSLSQQAAETALEEMQKMWGEEYSLHAKEQRKFQTRLERRWGKALGMLRMLLTLSRDFGASVVDKYDESSLNNVLTRLHVRACQITAEIITLLENGYADGAMARWRTLHEIAVVMILMREHGEQIAERYVAHGAVEAKAGKDQYLICYEMLGEQSLSTTECQRIDENYRATIAKYGKDFGGAYGWAEGYVPKPKSGRRVGLGDLEAAAGRTAFASHYKLASHNVHAGPHALFFQLGLLGKGGCLAGASNAGLTEPGQNTAISLMQISIFLAKEKIDLDGLVAMKVIKQLGESIPSEFILADQKLKEDHARHTGTMKKRRPLKPAGRQSRRFGSKHG